MIFHVYILKCSDNSYYTGHTDNLEQRLAQHQQRYFRSCYTATRLPVVLVYSQSFATREEALSSERQIKGWSRKKKEAMMRGDWNEVSRLAQNTLRQAQGERGMAVRGEPTLRPYAKLTGQGDRTTTVRGEPVEPHNPINKPKE